MKEKLWILFALFSLGLLNACGDDATSDLADEASFKMAVPSSQTLSIDVPDSSKTHALAVGDASLFYDLTRGISKSVNGNVGFFVAYLHMLTLLPPSETGDNYRVWGPSEPKGLEKVSWRLRVEKVDDNLFEFKLEGRPKGSTAEEDFKTVVSGQTEPGIDELHTKGQMTMDFNASKDLDSDPCHSGLVIIHWDASLETRKVDVEWKDFQNTCKPEENLKEAVYHFTQAQDGSGTFEFLTHANIHENDPTKPELETVLMNSRWQGDGAGRSDVIFKDGEVATDLAAAGLNISEIKATQCWSPLFTLTYADTDPDVLENFVFPNIGNVEDCPYSDAAYPNM